MNKDNLKKKQTSLLSINELLNDFDFFDRYNLEKNDIGPDLFHNPNGIHGISHAKRVLFLVLAISEMEKIREEDREILIEAAKYHDIGRGHDSTCYDHGILGFRKMIKMGLIGGESSEKEKIIRYIIENHCIDDEDAYANVDNYHISDVEHAMYLLDILKDGDNLDRVRIKDLDISYLRTDSARRLVPIAYELFSNKSFHGII